MLKIYVAPKKPEFLTIKEKENGTGVSVESKTKQEFMMDKEAAGEKRKQRNW